MKAKLEYVPIAGNLEKKHKKVIAIYILALLFISVNVVADEPGKKKNIKIEFTGFLKYNAMFDTRQTVNAREGNFMLYPEAPLYDEENKDVNAVSNFNMATINSMLRFKLTGTEMFNARSGAYIEFDFWGSESRKYVDLNHFRLRHAYITLTWKETEILFGQYWHPMSVAGFFPKVISANSGVPFHPISRNPQIRIQQKFDLLKIIGCVFTQRDFTSTGPDGADSKYLRNSGFPNMHLQLQLGNESSLLSGGAGIDYKMIVPELYVTTANGIVKSGKKNSLSSLSYVGFLKIKTKYFISTTQWVYATNAYDIILLGGYAKKEVVDQESGQKEFSNIRTVSYWSDLQTIGKLQFGLFCGYTQNLGSRDYIEGQIYARGANIHSIYRLSPRFVYDCSQLEISLEGEYTKVNYGLENGDFKGGVTGKQPVMNFRTILAVKYNF